MADEGKIKALFERYDTNKNGVLDRDEFFVVFEYFGGRVEKSEKVCYNTFR